MGGSSPRRHTQISLQPATTGMSRWGAARGPMRMEGLTMCATWAGWVGRGRVGGGVRAGRGRGRGRDGGWSLSAPPARPSGMATHLTQQALHQPGWRQVARALKLLPRPNLVPQQGLQGRRGGNKVCVVWGGEGCGAGRARASRTHTPFQGTRLPTPPTKTNAPGRKCPEPPAVTGGGGEQRRRAARPPAPARKRRRAP